MNYVQGRTSPTCAHATPEIAQTEAERLARLPDNIGREVFVLKAVKKCKVESAPTKWEEM
jgi:hypothetical protein